MLSSMMKSFDFVTLAYLLKVKGLLKEEDLVDIKRVSHILGKLIDKDYVTKKDFKEEKYKIVSLIYGLAQVYKSKDMDKLATLKEKYFVEFSQVFEEFEKTLNV